MAVPDEWALLRKAVPDDWALLRMAVPGGWQRWKMCFFYSSVLLKYKWCSWHLWEISSKSYFLLYFSGYLSCPPTPQADLPSHECTNVVRRGTQLVREMAWVLQCFRNLQNLLSVYKQWVWEPPTLLLDLWVCAVGWECVRLTHSSVCVHCGMCGIPVIVQSMDGCLFPAISASQSSKPRQRGSQRSAFPRADMKGMGNRNYLYTNTHSNTHTYSMYLHVISFFLSLHTHTQLAWW